MLKCEDWRVSEMSENALGVACDLRLFLHINSHCLCPPKREYTKDLSIIVRQTRNFALNPASAH